MKKYLLTVLGAQAAIGLVIPEAKVVNAEITEEQFLIFEQFANIEIDSDLNRVYVINALRMSIVPKLIS